MKPPTLKKCFAGVHAHTVGKKSWWVPSFVKSLLPQAPFPLQRENWSSQVERFLKFLLLFLIFFLLDYNF